VLEDQVIGRLALLLPAGVRAIRPYNGELSKPAADALQALNGLAPGILVSTTQGTFHGIAANKRRIRRKLDVLLYLLSVKASSPEDRARAPGQVYDLLDRTLKRLIGFKPDFGGLATPTGLMEPTLEEVMAHDATACIWKQHWDVVVEMERDEEPAPNVTLVDGSLNAPSEQDNAGDPIVQVSNLITT
jgi:hypothetical protein